MSNGEKGITVWTVAIVLLTFIAIAMVPGVLAFALILVVEMVTGGKLAESVSGAFSIAKGAMLITGGLMLVGTALVLTGCSRSTQMRREHLSSPFPLDRARAAVQLAEAGDSLAVDLLIDLLEDQDRGVRMYTILALERLCGETYGYRYFDPEPTRAAAVKRWREARQRGEVKVLARSSAPEASRPTRAAGATEGS